MKKVPWLPLLMVVLWVKILMGQEPLRLKPRRLKMQVGQPK